MRILFSCPPGDVPFGEVASIDEVDTFVEAFLQENPGHEQVTIWIDFGFEFRAQVFRSPKGEDVLIQRDGQERRFSCKSATNPDGELSICCRGHGSGIPIDYIEIPFWDGADVATDRGLLWLNPKAKSGASFTLYPRALDSSQTPSALVAAAHEALTQNFLRHFSG